MALIAFAGETGAIIVAEGIENEIEIDALTELGVRYGQAYHLGRPSPVTALTASGSGGPPADHENMPMAQTLLAAGG